MSYKFERAKVKRLINAAGSDFICYRFLLNNVKEKTETMEFEFAEKGVLHESVSYITTKTNDGSKVSKKNQPLLLVLKNDNTSKISIGDYIECNGIKYIVNGKVDVANANYAYDISLEVIA